MKYFLYCFPHSFFTGYIFISTEHFLQLNLSPVFTSSGDGFALIFLLNFLTPPPTLLWACLSYFTLPFLVDHVTYSGSPSKQRERSFTYLYRAAKHHCMTWTPEHFLYCQDIAVHMNMPFSYWFMSCSKSVSHKKYIIFDILTPFTLLVTSCD